MHKKESFIQKWAILIRNYETLKIDSTLHKWKKKAWPSSIMLKKPFLLLKKHVDNSQKDIYIIYRYRIDENC